MYISIQKSVMIHVLQNNYSAHSPANGMGRSVATDLELQEFITTSIIII